MNIKTNHITMEHSTSKLLAVFFGLIGGLTERLANGLCEYDWWALGQTLFVAILCGFMGAVGHSIYKKIFGRHG